MPGWHPRDHGFPLTLKLSLGFLALVFILIGLSGQSERDERTAVAPISLISIGRAEAVSYSPAYWNVHYRFEVHGRIYDKWAHVRWSREDVELAQVCYAPNDPDNQVMIKTDADCP